MTVNKTSKTITFITTENENKLMIAKELTKASYILYKDGKDTGYKFRSLKKALEFVEEEY
jgi:hypothetical protein